MKKEAPKGGGFIKNSQTFNAGRAVFGDAFWFALSEHCDIQEIHRRLLVQALIRKRKSL